MQVLTLTMMSMFSCRFLHLPWCQCSHAGSYTYHDVNVLMQVLTLTMMSMFSCRFLHLPWCQCSHAGSYTYHDVNVLMQVLTLTMMSMFSCRFLHLPWCQCSHAGSYTSKWMSLRFHIQSTTTCSSSWYKMAQYQQPTGVIFTTKWHSSVEITHIYSLSQVTDLYVNAHRRVQGVLIDRKHIYNYTHTCCVCVCACMHACAYSMILHCTCVKPTWHHNKTTDNMPWYHRQHDIWHERTVPGHVPPAVELLWMFLSHDVETVGDGRILLINKRLH